MKTKTILLAGAYLVMGAAPFSLATEQQCLTAGQECTVIGAADSFVIESFAYQLSTGVQAVWGMDSVAFGAAAINVKGSKDADNNQTVFAGNTDGGSVTGCTGVLGPENLGNDPSTYDCANAGESGSDNESEELEPCLEGQCAA